MRALPTSRSLLHFWEQAVFLEAALLADPETKHLAPPVTETLDDFSALLQKDLTARRVLVQAYAHGSVADADLDTGIRRVFSSTLHLTGQDRKRTEFTSLFGSSIAAIVRHALRKQLEVTKDLLRRLSTLSVFPDSFKNDATAILSPLVAAGDAAVEEQKQAEVARIATRLDVTAWKEEVNALRLSVYAQLLSIASKTGRKRSWAEAFFPSQAGRAVPSGEEPEDGPSHEDTDPIDEGDTPPVEG